jgi:hypothetical protein
MSKPVGDIKVAINGFITLHYWSTYNPNSKLPVVINNCLSVFSCPVSA